MVGPGGAGEGPEEVRRRPGDAGQEGQLDPEGFPIRFSGHDKTPQFMECSLRAGLDPPNRPLRQLCYLPHCTGGKNDAQCPHVTHPSPPTSKEHRRI